ALARSNDDVVVIETSSQGLHQYRMAGMQFDYALFTNLQHDHLDYHKTMEAYYQAKKSLFSLMKADGKAVINSYTMWGNRLAKELAASGKQVLTVDTKKDATSYVLDKTTDTAVVAFNGQGGQIEAIEAPLSGVYNQENLILATTVMVDLGLDAGNTNDAIADFAGIAGRLEYYPLADGNEMVVDYAHTPDAIEALLTTLNAQYPNHETIHIFGFRGQRDTKKFPQMVSASQTGADLTILTTDDLNGVPRQEMAEKYLEYVTQYGLDSMAMALDRVEAVELALEMSLNPVLLVLTGKGHEAYSEENK
ncbi:Mur ligase family protein, partial [Aerococcus sp. L_32]